MKIKLIVMITLLIHLVCMSVAWAESEDLSEMDKQTGGGGAGTMICPVQGSWTLTSPQGGRIHPIYGVRKYHSGADLAAEQGTPIVACQSGTVVYAGWIDGYGNAVIIDHGAGVTSLYGHNSELLVSAGQKVSQGDRIALCGSTGNSTGPHCHWEVRINDHPVDPGLFCPEVEQAEMAYDPNHVPERADGVDSIDGKATFEVSADFAKPLRDISNKFVDVITARGGLTLIDTPGQIEVFTWSASGAVISESLAAFMPTVYLYVVDTARCVQNPQTFMANMTYACSILYKTKLPLIVVFTKTDVVWCCRD